MKDDNFGKNKEMLTLEELENRKGYNTVQMAKALGMTREDYSRTRNGKPPKWFLKAVKLSGALYDLDGILPTQLKLTEKKEGYRIDADS